MNNQMPYFWGGNPNNQGCQCRGELQRINQRIDRIDRDINRINRRLDRLERMGQFSSQMPFQSTSAASDNEFQEFQSGNYMI